MTYCTFFISPPYYIWNLVCILHLQHLSIQVSHRWLMTAGLNKYLFPAYFFLPSLSSFFPPWGTVHSHARLFTHLSLPSQFCCSLSYIWRVLLGSGDASSGKRVVLPLYSFFPGSTPLHLSFVHAYEQRIAPTQGQLAEGASVGFAPRRGGLYSPWREARGLRAHSSNAFPRPSAFSVPQATD